MNSSKDSSSSLWQVYRWMLHYLKPYRWKVFFTVGCGVVMTAGETIFPKAIQYFIDNISMTKDYNAFIMLLLLLAVLVIAVIAAGNARNLLERIVGVKASRDNMTCLSICVSSDSHTDSKSGNQRYREQLHLQLRLQRQRRQSAYYRDQQKLRLCDGRYFLDWRTDGG
ncbi:hypothetical protein L1N85_21475 [Paenibacillus alkaliterrae]|uniref:hypothetical protein n=1 Tax=Paenibacillus alkaliterrae TaxID=320909 RepID=UPI001F28F875|nr:hypothetical protein [Paenibacillus alkaliterrae]MCF2940961.1 hypothetical protein [Paenibacillus alkaliterrae]